LAANHNFGLVIYNGGTLYTRAKSTATGMAETIPQRRSRQRSTSTCPRVW
jgi:hypothetical protein